MNYFLVWFLKNIDINNIEVKIDIKLYKLFVYFIPVSIVDIKFDYLNFIIFYNSLVGLSSSIIDKSL